jgi:CDP-diacylglycerol--glycerol-3-phosphate 3-phosphatidyltransferase
VEKSMKPQPATLTDALRVRFKDVLKPIGEALHRMGITANMITFAGLVGNVIGAVLIATGHITWGGVLVLLMGPFDALDGTLARLQGPVTKFGSLLDSVIDRYSELVILGGLLAYYLTQPQLDGTACLLVFLAAAGSVMVSYVKARAEGLGLTVNVGLLTRVERYLVTAPALVFNVPMVALWVLAVLANFTALQRMWHVWKTAGNQLK